MREIASVIHQPGMWRMIPTLCSLLLGGLVVACGSGTSGGASPTDVALQTVQAQQGTAFAATIAASKPTPGTPSPPATATSSVPPTPQPTVSMLTIVSVSDARPGDTATVVVQTDPKAGCSIKYIHPSGKLSTTRGLVDQRADATGKVIWNFHIDTTTQKGDGTVIVACTGHVTQAPIHII